MCAGNIRALAHLMHTKLKKLTCACIIARNLGIRMLASEHTLHMRDARHKCALHEPRTLYMCGVATVDVRIQ